MIHVPPKLTRSFQIIILILLPVSIHILPAAGLSGCAQKLPVDEGRMVIALLGAPVNADPRVTATPTASRSAR